MLEDSVQVQTQFDFSLTFFNNTNNKEEEEESSGDSNTGNIQFVDWLSVSTNSS